MSMWAAGSNLTEYTWDYGDDKPKRCIGMFEDDGTKHGIVRTEWFNGTFEDATWFSTDSGEELRHGLRRLISH